MGLGDALARAHADSAERDARQADADRVAADRLVVMEQKLHDLANEAIAYCRLQDLAQTAGHFSVEPDNSSRAPRWTFDLVTPLWEFKPFVLDEAGNLSIYPTHRSLVPQHVYIYNRQIDAALNEAVRAAGLSVGYTALPAIELVADPRVRVTEWDPHNKVVMNAVGVLWRNQAVRSLEDEIAQALAAAQTA